MKIRMNSKSFHSLPSFTVMQDEALKLAKLWLDFLSGRSFAKSLGISAYYIQPTKVQITRYTITLGSIWITENPIDLWRNAWVKHWTFAWVKVIKIISSWATPMNTQYCVKSFCVCNKWSYKWCCIEKLESLFILSTLTYPHYHHYKCQPECVTDSWCI